MSIRALKSARERLGESQAVFAQRFGVDQGTYSRWESGVRNPSGSARLLIKRVLVELEYCE